MKSASRSDRKSTPAPFAGNKRRAAVAKISTDVRNIENIREEDRRELNTFINSDYLSEGAQGFEETVIVSVSFSHGM